MTSKPFSLRLSNVVSDLITARTKKHDKSASEIVRDALEFTYRDEMVDREAFLKLMNNPSAALSNIKKKLYPDPHSGECQDPVEFKREEMSFIAHSLHNAYLLAGHNDLLNCEYMNIILAMTFELMEAFSHFLSEDEGSLRYSLSNLTLLNHPNWQSALPDLIKQFRENPNSNYADFITRPITCLADDLHLLDSKTLHTIFTRDRINALFPVLTYELRQNTNEGNYFTSAHTEQLFQPFPSSTVVIEKPLLVTLYNTNTLCLLITQPNSHNSWGMDEIFDLINFSENFHSNGNLNNQGRSLKFHSRPQPDRVEITSNKDGFRFFFSQAQFQELANSILAVKDDPQWKSVFSFYRTEQGDI